MNLIMLYSYTVILIFFLHLHFITEEQHAAQVWWKNYLHASTHPIPHLLIPSIYLSRCADSQPLPSNEINTFNWVQAQLMSHVPWRFPPHSGESPGWGWVAPGPGEERLPAWARDTQSVSGPAPGKSCAAHRSCREACSMQGWALHRNSKHLELVSLIVKWRSDCFELWWVVMSKIGFDLLFEGNVYTILIYN